MNDPRDVQVACSVIMAAHNAAKTIDAQLLALSRQNFDRPFEVVVVANRCSDNTRQIVEGYARGDRFAGCRFRVVVADDRASLAYARNVGVLAAISDYIVVCDADDIVWASWLSRLYRSLQMADIVGGALVHWDSSRFPDPLTMDEPRLSVPGVRYGFLPAAVGANHGFNRAVWEQIGGYSESSMSAEDTDFVWRAQIAGAELRVDEKARVYYRDRPTLGGIYARERAYGRSEVRLFCRFEPYGMPRYRSVVNWPSVRYVHLILTTYRLLSADGRRKWIAHLAKNVGRLRGSIEDRTIFL